MNVLLNVAWSCCRGIVAWSDEWYEIGFECNRNREPIPRRSYIAGILEKLGLWKLSPIPYEKIPPEEIPRP